MMQNVNLGIGDVVAARGEAQLTIYALGSCVGLCLYDGETRIGCMGHILLPRCPTLRNGALFAVRDAGKYADTATEGMVRMMRSLGAGAFSAKLFGGARMFPFGASGAFQDIGAMNQRAVTDGLRKWNIPVIESEVGGSRARTVCFDLRDGSVRVGMAGVAAEGGRAI